MRRVGSTVAGDICHRIGLNYFDARMNSLVSHAPVRVSAGFRGREEGRNAADCRLSLATVARRFTDEPLPTTSHGEIQSDGQEHACEAAGLADGVRPDRRRLRLGRSGRNDRSSRRQRDQRDDRGRRGRRVRHDRGHGRRGRRGRRSAGSRRWRRRHADLRRHPARDREPCVPRPARVRGCRARGRRHQRRWRRARQRRGVAAG